MAAIDYEKLYASSKKTPKSESNKNKEKSVIQTLKDEMTRKLKNDPDLAEKAAQIIIEMLNSSSSKKGKK